MRKKFWVLLAIAYTTALTVVSLMSLRKLPDVEVAFGDKIFHFLSYFVLTLLWVFAFFLNYNLEKSKSIMYAFIAAVIFGIIIEVLQGAFTLERSFDIYDMLANTFGALLATGLLSVYNLKHIKKL